MIVIFLGIYPAPAIDLMSSAVNKLVEVVNVNSAMALTGR